MNIVDQIRLIINETGNAVFWPENQLDDAINEATFGVWITTKHRVTSTNVALGTANQLFSVPSSIMIPQRVIYNNQEYFPTDMTKLEQWDCHWQSRTPGQPRFYVLWDIEHILAVPLPDTTYTVTIQGVQWPPQVDITTQDYTEDPLFKLAVANRAAANLVKSTRPDLATALLKESADYANRVRIEFRNRQSNNILRLRPATAFENGGVIRIGQRLG